MNKPIIGITKPDKKDFMAFSALWGAVKIAGGDPIVLSPSRNPYQEAAVDGLLLGGGKDVFPGLYDHPPKKEYMYDRARDEMEIFWAEHARDEKIPALGICRGAQLMNVVCGGNLHTSVADAYENAHYPDGLFHHVFYRKNIVIKPDSLLHKILMRQNLKVNSIHKQAIAKLGDDMEVNAQESNGVIQAVALKTHPFFLGIQFHPEFLIYHQTFRILFKAFIERAAERNALVYA